MKFVIGKEEKTTQTVTFYKPGDHSKKNKCDLDVTYKVLPVDRFREIESNDIVDEELMTEVITNIDGVFDESGAELPFSDEVLDGVMNDVHAKMAIIEMFLNIHTKQGRQRARRKN